MEALWVLVLLVSATASADRSRDLADDADKYLLPWNIRPEHYDLTLYTHIEQFQEEVEESFVFMGLTEITFTVLYEDISEVVLHTYDTISIASALIVNLDGEAPVLHNVTIGSYDPETKKQTFNVSPRLKTNDRYRIEIYYIGHHYERLRGFFRTSYRDNNNQTKWLVGTHFESFDARQAFPCFDEPEYKATFKLAIHYNQTLATQNYTAFFNTEIESEEIRGGVHITTFKTTPRPISTYLVAFILAPFATSPELAYFNSSFNGENAIKPLRTIGQPKYFSPRQDLLSQVAGPAALNVMTRLTGVGFGLDKVELAGIPGDFGPGAMENWGLLTFRETALFFNNETGTTAQKQSITSTATHELAHQWFGDLVTLYWWSDVWLNEGFATFFATRAANEFREPDLNTSDWNLIGQFVTGTLQKSAFQIDGRPNSRPLTSEAYNPDTIDSNFDSISYDKGASVLRMWSHILGSEIFFAGLNRYLKQQEESVGTPEILLASWDGVIDSLPPGQRPELPDTVANLFEGWHHRAGYPVVTVTRQSGNLTITQERFLSSAGNDSTHWNVPLSYSTNVEDNFENMAPVGFLLASEPSTTLRLRNASADWVVLNNQATGYYRVNYDSENWEKLIAIVNNSDTAGLINEYNRAQILDDAANLAASTHKQYLSYTTILQLLRSLRHERSLIVWTPALRAMNFLLTHLADHEGTHSLLKEYFSWLVEPAFNELSLYVREADSHTKKLLRADLAKMACFLDLPVCQQQASKLFAARSPHPDVRAVVMCEGVKHGGAAEWEYVLDEALRGEGIVREDLLSALTCSKDNTLIDGLLKLVLDVELFNDYEVRNILIALHRNNPGKSWISSVMEISHSRKWKTGRSSKNYLKEVVILAADPLKAIPHQGGKDISLEVIEVISYNQEWYEKKQKEIKDWLSGME